MTTTPTLIVTTSWDDGHELDLKRFMQGFRRAARPIVVEHDQPVERVQVAHA